MNELYNDLLEVLDYAKERQEAEKALPGINLDYIRGVVAAAGNQVES